MIEFSPKDASILARVAQYERVFAAARREILNQADSEDTRVVGRILLGDHIEGELKPEIRDAVTAVQNWVRDNRGIAHRRSGTRSPELEMACALHG